MLNVDVVLVVLLEVENEVVEVIEDKVEELDVVTGLEVVPKSFSPTKLQTRIMITATTAIVMAERRCTLIDLSVFHILISKNLSGYTRTVYRFTRHLRSCGDVYRADQGGATRKAQVQDVHARVEQNPIRDLLTRVCRTSLRST